MEFEWDSRKAVSNFRKHDVSFEEAMTVFDDPRCFPLYDSKHSDDQEERELLIGVSERLRILTVCFTQRGDNFRIISARRATLSERRMYEES